MENKNIHIMKQPELGKKLAELRKSNGLTQEELVEKCNISVRTIQRIEAGEVTPRSYTLKTILNALEVNFETVIKKGNKAGFFKEFFANDSNNKSLRNFLLLACFFGVIYFIIGFFEVGFEFAKYFGDSFGNSNFGYILVYTLNLGTEFTVQFGLSFRSGVLNLRYNLV